MYTCCVERINYEDFLDSKFTHTLNALLGSTNVIGPAVCWCGLLLEEEFPVSTSQGRVRRLIKTSSAMSHQGEVVWNFQESGPLIGQAAQESGPLIGQAALKTLLRVCFAAASRLHSITALAERTELKPLLETGWCVENSQAPCCQWS